MKITIHFAGSSVYCGMCGEGSYSANIYLNGELVGWSGWFEKVKLKNVPEGENTIEIKGVTRRRIRFIANQNVKIWARADGVDVELLVKGEDIKILENVVIKEGRGEEEITEGPSLDGKPEKEPEEGLWESFKNKYI